jgi:hypothetical protein
MPSRVERKDVRWRRVNALGIALLYLEEANLANRRQAISASYRERVFEPQAIRKVT